MEDAGWDQDSIFLFLMLIKAMEVGAVQHLWLYNLKLEQAMKNFTCVDQQIFFCADLIGTGEGWNWGKWLLNFCVFWTCFSKWGSGGDIEIS